MVGCLHRLVGLAQDALQFFVGRRGGFSRVSVVRESGVELCHLGAIVAGALGHSDQSRGSCRSCADHALEAVAHEVGQGRVDSLEVPLGLLGRVAQAVHRVCCLLSRPLVVVQLLGGRDDLALQLADLCLGDIASLELLLHLLLSLAQGFQLFAGALHGLGQHLLLLCQQLGIAWVKLELAVNLGQLSR